MTARVRNARPVPRLIQVQRQDFNGRVITIRHDDLKALACILDLESEQASRQLDDLGLRQPRPVPA